MKSKLARTIVLALLATSAYAASQKPVVVHTFLCNGDPSQRIGPCSNGAQPNFLIQGSNGNIYGTAWAAEEGENTPSGGAIFSLTPAGKFTLLHLFVAGTNGNFANGGGPVSLTEGPDGNLYGITQFGGNGPNAVYPNFGVVFRVSRTGTGFKVIHRFCSVGTSCSDGGGAVGPLVASTDGNLYGVTSEGGTDSRCSCGTIFMVTPSSGAYEVVQSFNPSTDGFYPNGLIPAADGTFYGLTIQGDDLFHFTPATGALESTKLPFPFASGCAEGCFAQPFLTIAANGNLYGLYTFYQTGGLGLFDVQLDGSHFERFPEYNTTLNGGGGMELLPASDGKFWIPENPGVSAGDVISLSPSDGKVIRRLAPFSASAAVGAFPSWLMQAKDGTLWGTASDYGIASTGHFGGGTVYRLNLGLPPR
jgi:uncharacterized repeat protein (TIGR03803 family)